MKKSKVGILSLSLVMLIGITSLVYAANNESKGHNLGKSYKENVKKDRGKDKIVATVNDENIYGSEVDYLKWQYENSSNDMKPFPAEDNNTTTLIKKIAKEKLVLAEAKTNKIMLTDTEKERIQKNVADSFDKNAKENQDFIDSLAMTKEEVAKMIVEMQMNAITEAKFMSEKVLPTLLENKLQNNDITLNNKVVEYQQYIKNPENNLDGKAKSEKLKGLYEAYKDSLLVKAKFKTLN